ncbi:helicase-related protein [Pullulanibacillus sp. KACC 23026]|uniref:DEAD/DEAH box helicase n=1 Tax=Pullulanibacillus sp. KACC 23026 TaxID=3028315 RepID=UPI0023AF9F04|nr:helicase-related protein [Pullulanibacillus sp. KACC 23026]WEG13593.1 helicase-related protein [Pullulanibacillus sp. KACC 23026]
MRAPASIHSSPPLTSNYHSAVSPEPLPSNVDASVCRHLNPALFDTWYAPLSPKEPSVHLVSAAPPTSTAYFLDTCLSYFKKSSPFIYEYEPTLQAFITLSWRRLLKWLHSDRFSEENTAPYSQSSQIDATFDQTATHRTRGQSKKQHPTHALTQSIRNETHPAYSSSFCMPLDPDFSPNQQLQVFLAGRLLLMSECQAFPLKELEAHFKAGYLQIQQGITCVGGIPFCHRCGNHVFHQFVSHTCRRCGRKCLYCRECLEMGLVRSCTALVKWRGPSPPLLYQEVQLNWEGTLTVEQQEASDKLLHSVKARQNFLVWAVCGAGKTEVLYQTLKNMIEQGKRVAIASPRSDVILELDRRIGSVFPTLSRVAIYGDSPDDYTFTPFVLTTLHQLRRFESAFDLIVIDEVDAFPFKGNQALNTVLQRALMSDGSLVFVTATPDREMKKAYLHGRLNGIHIPIRFHRGPLPEPKFVWIGDWKKKLSRGKLHESLYKWLQERIQDKRRVFLFVPEIGDVEPMVLLLNKKQFLAEGAHSKDPMRRDKVLAFREGRHHIMVTTTILERGVTISRADVAILGAERPIFDERALVQMSGRAGRDRENPDGEVVFFHNGKTREMLRALRHIQFMNHEAMKLTR